MFDDFTKETGITVRYDTFDGNDTLEAKLFAGQSGYDVVVPTAYFLGRQIEAGLYRKLDKSKLPNLVNAWPEIADRLAVYDPGNQYAVNYMWGTTGIGYNIKAVRDILGPDAVIDSWDYVFDPDKIKKFKDCGIHLFDSSDDVMSAGLSYLHLDPNSSDPADLEKVTDLLIKIRPYVRKFHSLEYLNALATGEICFAMGFSGDVKQAQRRAAEAKAGIALGYAIPKEGAQLWLDNLAIPNDAPHVAEAHALIDYLLSPRSRPKIPTTCSTPTATGRASSSTLPSATTAPSIRTHRPWRAFTRSWLTIRRRSGWSIAFGRGSRRAGEAVHGPSRARRFGSAESGDAPG